VGEARRQEDYAGVPYYYAGPVSYPQPYVYYSPNAYCAPGYYYQPARPNYAVGGTLLGAASGALIGEGSGHNAGQGAAIGAAAGLVLGGAAELAAQHHERSVVASQPVPVALPAPPQTARRPGEPAARAFQASYMPQRYQISDAPRVPDAPTF